MSRNPLRAATVDRLDEIIAETQSRGRAPSLIAAVVRDGELLHFCGAGELPRPDSDTQYRIGSITKTMTAALLLGLRDEGRLSLDDPLERHLPGTPAGAATLRQLLSHLSGLQREPDGDWWERSAGAGLDELVAGVTTAKLAHPTQRGHHYSNLAYGLLGAVLTRITGQPWAELLDKRLLEPLAMRRTTYHPAEPFARGYLVHPWHATLHEEPRHDTGAMAPAGQLWSTTADLARWAAFLGGAVPSVLAPTTIAEMCAPVVLSDLDSWTSGQGLGVQLWRRGERVYVGHAGSMPGYRALLAVHRPSGTGVVAFANAYTLHSVNLGEVGRDLLTLVLDHEPLRPQPWRPGTAPPPEVEPLTGRWWWMGQEYQAGWDAGRSELVVTALTGAGAADAWRFTEELPDHWRCHSGSNNGEIAVVRRAADGAITALEIATFIFTRDPWPPL